MRQVLILGGLILAVLTLVIAAATAIERGDGGTSPGYHYVYVPVVHVGGDE